MNMHDAGMNTLRQTVANAEQTRLEQQFTNQRTTTTTTTRLNKKPDMFVATTIQLSCPFYRHA